MILAGKLDKRVEIQERVFEVLPGGAREESWPLVEEVWASIRTLKAREQTEASNVKGFRTHRIRMRFFPGLTSANRIVHNGTTYHIDGVTHSDRRGVSTEAMVVSEDA